MPIALIWQYKDIIMKVVAVALIAFVAWWYFIHNPKVIEGLEADKRELARRVENGQQAAGLLQDIQEGHKVIDDATFKQISTIRAHAVPRRAVLIRGGVPMSTVHKTGTSH